MVTRLLAIILFLISVVFAAPAVSSYNYLFEHFSTDDGLSHNSVSAMIKDRKGFMWFATWDGICRYDGTAFKTYNKISGSHNKVISSRISKMEEDQYGCIWIHTFDLKVFRFNKNTETFDDVLVEKGFDESTRISSVYQTKNGDVWLLSENSGIYHVQTDSGSLSLEISHFYHGGKLPLPGNKIVFMKEDAKQRYWINTDKGAVVYQQDISGVFNKVELSEHVANVFNRYALTSANLKNNYLTFGTDNGVLLVYNQIENGIKQVRLETPHVINQLENCNDSVLYIGTKGSGVYQYNFVSHKITAHYTNTKMAEVLKIYPDSKGLLWVEAFHEGIFRVDTKKQNVKHFTQQVDVKQAINNYAQGGLNEDADGTIWLTLKGGGFGVYNRSSDEVEYFFNQPGDDQSVMSNYIYCLYRDDNIMWLSTYFKGLEKVSFVENRFRFFQPVPKLKNSIANEVRALLEADNGDMWVANKKGELFVYDAHMQLKQKITHLEGIELGMVYAIMQDSEGKIWMGTKGNGLFVLSDFEGANFSVSHFLANSNRINALSNNSIYSILEDKNGYIWIGTYGGGVNLFRNGNFFHYRNVFQNYPIDKAFKVRHLNQDRDGNIWAATTNGLIYFDPSQQSLDSCKFNYISSDFSRCEGLPRKDVYWVHCDTKGGVWAATMGGGLSRLKGHPSTADEAKFSTYTKVNGLAGNVIYSIAEDDSSNLWLATDNGISRFSLSDTSFYNYDKYDGLEKVGFSEGAVFEKSNGEICFGSSRGVYCFNPKQIPEIKRTVPLVFTGLKLFGHELIPDADGVLKKSITETSVLQLQHFQNSLAISWAGLDYKYQEKLQYAYKLEGYDLDWQNVGRKNYATYNKLQSGKYTFKVKFLNADLMDRVSPIELILDIQPPIWRTYWAYALYLVLLVALLFVARAVILTILKLRNKVVIEKELSAFKIDFFYQCIA